MINDYNKGNRSLYKFVLDTLLIRRLIMKDVTNSASDQWSQFKQNFTNKSGNNRNWNGRYLYIVLAIAIFIYYYIALPPIHYASFDFWLFVILIVAGIIIIELIHDSLSLFKSDTDTETSFNFKNLSIKYKILLYPWPVLIIIGALSYFILSPFFFSRSYSEMIQVDTADFEQGFPETDINQIPLVDRDTAERLGNRQLGNLTELVSQFVAADDYTQININSYPYRVTPLEYAGFFRWLNNFREGIPHYLQVDNVTGEVRLMTPESPIKYSDAELFNRDVMRRLRFSNPFKLFESPTFEVDDDGNPYYIASTYTRNFFIREPEVNGVITLNAMTGETEYYALGSVPDWIDRVYSADLILHQLTLQGHYRNGFWNSIFAKEGVTEPTAGYNYLPIGDDLYLYTGITSVVADESNIGFVLVNLRTKEATMYPLSAAEEFSAMRSAEGSVQETSYQATFPLLINIEGRPMYILTLKDNSGLIKEYALVDVQNYQRVYVAPSVPLLMQEYARDNPINVEEIETEEELETFDGQLDQIQAVVEDGNTIYYFTFDGTVYKADLTLNPHLPFLEEGTDIEFTATENGRVREINWETQ